MRRGKYFARAVENCLGQVRGGTTRSARARARNNCHRSGAENFSICRRSGVGLWFSGELRASNPGPPSGQWQRKEELADRKLDRTDWNGTERGRTPKARLFLPQRRGRSRRRENSKSPTFVSHSPHCLRRSRRKCEAKIAHIIRQRIARSFCPPASFAPTRCASRPIHFYRPRFRNFS